MVPVQWNAKKPKHCIQKHTKEEREIEGSKKYQIVELRLKEENKRRYNNNNSSRDRSFQFSEESEPFS